MGFTRRLLFAILLLSATIHGQNAPPSALTIVDLSDSEQTAFIHNTMELGFPINRADQMTMLILNRSTLTLPLIESWIEQALKSNPTQAASVETAAEMIAYAGDQTALREVSKLVAVDENRFGRLVRRTLENAGSFRNPFGVVYDGLAMDDTAISRLTMQWVESALASSRMQRKWAEALLIRYGKVPDDSEWANDPLASRLKDQASPELRRTILSLAEDAKRKREQN